MKNLKFIILAGSLCLILSCRESFVLPVPEGGGVKIALTQDVRSNELTVKSTTNLPSVEDFEVEIYNSRAVRLYRDTYANTVGKEIPLNGGDYRILAQHGDSLGAGFDIPYYVADENFTVHGQNVEEINAVAKLGNVRIAVNFGETLKTQYSFFYAKVRRKAGKSVTYAMDETRYAYLPGGEFILELYADVDGSMKYYQAEPITCSPNDFITFNVETSSREGSLSVNVKIDDSVNLVEKTVEIPASALPADKPQLTVTGFNDREYKFIEGVPSIVTGVYANLSAGNGIAHLYMDFKSSYLESLGLKSPLDIAVLSDGDRALLKKSGIVVPSDLAGSKFSFVNFAGLLENISSDSKYSPDAPAAEFSLRLEDNEGVSVSSENYKVTLIPGKATLTEISELDVWATKINSVSAVVSDGAPEKFVLEYSMDGNSWMAVNPTSVSDHTLSFGTVAGFVPGTEYKLRLKYNDNENSVSELATVKTEAAQQIGNAGFEDWTELTYNYNIIISTKASYTYFQPWSNESSAWWAQNSAVAMKNDVTGLTRKTVKSFLTVGCSTDSHSDAKSAVVFSCNVGNANTNSTAVGTTYVGDLWLGKASENGSHESEGHSFMSRPTALSFYYKFSPKGSENFYAKVELKAQDDSILFSKEITDGQSASEWTEFRIPFEYTDLRKKAASIYLQFKSSSSKKPGVSTGNKIELNGSEREAHVGSVLRIDDIKVEY